MKQSLSALAILPLFLFALLAQSLVARGGDEPAHLPLECRIRAVHKGGESALELKISLENTGGPPLRVMTPNWWFDMSAASMIGGWEFNFIGPDGKPAKLDWGVPPPSPKPLMLPAEQTAVLRQGAFVGITLPIKGQLADLEKVSKVIVTYWVKENFKKTYFLEETECLKEMRPPLWEGKVVSNVFDIASFMQRQAIKAAEPTR